MSHIQGGHPKYDGDENECWNEVNELLSIQHLVPHLIWSVSDISNPDARTNKTTDEDRLPKNFKVLSKSADERGS
jgi:hypothetical protein